MITQWLPFKASYRKKSGLQFKYKHRIEGVNSSGGVRRVTNATLIVSILKIFLRQMLSFQLTDNCLLSTAMHRHSGGGSRAGVHLSRIPDKLQNREVVKSTLNSKLNHLQQ